jgi:aminoglycoside phosphotransferase (APT) family kinase protein
VDRVAAGGRLRRVRPLRGGGAMAVHRLDIDRVDGTRLAVILRRWARPGGAETDPDHTAAAEVRVLAALGRTNLAVAVPRVLAADPDGVEADVPALVQELLPGRPRSRSAPLGRAAISSLAAMLAEIHDLGPTVRRVVGDFAPFWTLDETPIPAASTRPELWARALDVAGRPPPPTRPTFLHRDFHPGNVLWVGSRISGILDWTGACWGPAAADLAHLKVNLAVDHGITQAETAGRAYRAVGGRLDDTAYWDIRMLLDWLPDLDPEYASGPGLERMERYAEHLLRSF